MVRYAFAALAGVTALAAVAVVAAPRPAAIAQAVPGMWVIEGLPGADSPARECMADLAALAQIEHRGRTCSQKVVSDSPGLTVVEYSCGSGEFGRSEMKLITPRSLRVQTQGISEKLPFNYVLQARRVGDCPATDTAQSH
jgi:hypothetical protein